MSSVSSPDSPTGQDHSFGADAILRKMSIWIGARCPVVSLLELPFFWHGTTLVVHFCYKCLKQDCTFGIKTFLVSCYYGKVFTL